MKTKLSDAVFAQTMTVNEKNEIVPRQNVREIFEPVFGVSPRNLSYADYLKYCERHRITPEPLWWAGLTDDIGKDVS